MPDISTKIPDSLFEKEIEKRPRSKTAQLENHILGESFHMDHLDIHKIDHQSADLEHATIDYLELESRR